MYFRLGQQYDPVVHYWSIADSGADGMQKAQNPRSVSLSKWTIASVARIFFALKSAFVDSVS